MCIQKKNVLLFIYSLALESGIKNNTDLNYFYSYVIFTNARVGNIRS